MSKTPAESAELKAFDEMLDKKIDESGFGEACATGKTKPPKILYHYTSVEGLQGIFTPRTTYAEKPGHIRGTHYKYLNDTSEYSYANELFNTAINKRKNRAVSKRVKIVLEAIQATPGGLLTFTEPYIACFCSHGNLLSQWRAYGARGGYALGLIPSHTMKHELHSGYGLYKVEYKVNKQNIVINMLLDELCKKIDELPADINPTLRAPLFEAVFDKENYSLACIIYLPDPLKSYLFSILIKFAMIAACMKSEYFASEKEWRLVHMELNAGDNPFLRNKQLRTAGGLLVPYVELPLFLEGLTEESLLPQNFKVSSITYGPSLHPDLARRSLELLVASLGLPYPVEIKGSKIPVKL